MAHRGVDDVSAAKRPRLGMVHTSRRAALPGVMHLSGARKNSAELGESVNILNYFAVVTKQSASTALEFGSRMDTAAKQSVIEQQVGKPSRATRVKRRRQDVKLPQDTVPDLPEDLGHGQITPRSQALSPG